MSPLGCGSHTYSITHRSGGFVTASGVLTSVEWNRTLNDSSTAQVTIGVSGANCCAELSQVRSWSQWLNLYRDDAFVWSGPITGVDWGAETVTVTAVDLIGLLDRRVPHQNFTFTDTDVTEIARQLVEDGLAPDDPGHTTTVIGPAMVTGGRTYAQNVGQTADHLRDLADGGMDFTASGNNIIILPDGFCDVVGRLSDADLPEGVTVTEDGASLATRQIVSADTESTIVGTADATGAVRDYYGLLEVYSQDTSIVTQADAQTAAAARLASSAATPIVIDSQNVTLAPTANVDLRSLVPGWCLQITTSATCLPVSQVLKIVGVQVSEDGGSGDTPGQERVLVQVAASGSEGTVLS
jgi:hypothetical protein